jgi:hypothetical protein
VFRRFGSGRYLDAVASVVRRTAIPYGYTITIWTAGGVIVHRHGTPNVGDAYLYLLGAVAGFAGVGLLAVSHTAHRFELASADLLRTGAINVLALSLALGAAALIAMIHGTAVWPLGSFAATTIYLLVASADLILAHRDSAAGSQPDDE